MPYCVRWGPIPPLQKGSKAPKFSAHVYCGQTAGWIKMPLGMAVGFGPGHIVLDGDPALPSPKRGTAPPNFRPMSIVPKRLDGSTFPWYGGRPRPRPHCARWKPAPLPRKGGTAPHFRRMLWPNGWMDQDVTWYKDRPRPRATLRYMGNQLPLP